MSTGISLPGASQASAHLEPVGARHEDVEDDRVRLRFELEPSERLLTVLGELHAIPLELERPPQRVAHRTLVVDDQDLHRAALCALASSRGAGLSDFLGRFQRRLSGCGCYWSTSTRKDVSVNSSRNRTPLFLAGLIAAVGLGAGAGATAYAVLSDESTTVVRQVTVADSEPAATADGLSIASIYQRSYKAVVEITATATQFSGSQSAQGSGFVFDEAGHIVTNQHVVEGASSISVRFWDGSTRDGAARRHRSVDRPRGDRRQCARVVPRAAPHSATRAVWTWEKASSPWAAPSGSRER